MNNPNDGNVSKKLQQTLNFRAEEMQRIVELDVQLKKLSKEDAETGLVYLNNLQKQFESKLSDILEKAKKSNTSESLQVQEQILENSLVILFLQVFKLRKYLLPSIEQKSVPLQMVNLNETSILITNCRSNIKEHFSILNSDFRGKCLILFYLLCEVHWSIEIKEFSIFAEIHDIYFQNIIMSCANIDPTIHFQTQSKRTRPTLIRFFAGQLLSTMGLIQIELKQFQAAVNNINLSIKIRKSCLKDPTVLEIYLPNPGKTMEYELVIYYLQTKKCRCLLKMSRIAECSSFGDSIYAKMKKKRDAWNSQISSQEWAQFSEAAKQLTGLIQKTKEIIEESKRNARNLLLEDNDVGNILAAMEGKGEQQNEQSSTLQFQGVQKAGGLKENNKGQSQQLLQLKLINNVSNRGITSAVVKDTPILNLEYLRKNIRKKERCSSNDNFQTKNTLKDEGNLASMQSQYEAQRGGSLLSQNQDRQTPRNLSNKKKEFSSTSPSQNLRVTNLAYFFKPQQDGGASQALPLNTQPPVKSKKNLRRRGPAQCNFNFNSGRILRQSEESSQQLLATTSGGKQDGQITSRQITTDCSTAFQLTERKTKNKESQFTTIKETGDFQEKPINNNYLDEISKPRKKFSVQKLSFQQFLPISLEALMPSSATELNNQKINIPPSQDTIPNNEESHQPLITSNTPNRRSRRMRKSSFQSSNSLGRQQSQGSQQQLLQQFTSPFRQCNSTRELRKTSTDQAPQNPTKQQEQLYKQIRFFSQPQDQRSEQYLFKVNSMAETQPNDNIQINFLQNLPLTSRRENDIQEQLNPNAAQTQDFQKQQSLSPSPSIIISPADVISQQQHQNSYTNPATEKKEVHIPKLGLDKLAGFFDTQLLDLGRADTLSGKRVVFSPQNLNISEGFFNDSNFHSAKSFQQNHQFFKAPSFSNQVLRQVQQHSPQRFNNKGKSRSTNSSVEKSNKNPISIRSRFLSSHKESQEITKISSQEYLNYLPSSPRSLFGSNQHSFQKSENQIGSFQVSQQQAQNILTLEKTHAAKPYFSIGPSEIPKSFSLTKRPQINKTPVKTSYQQPQSTDDKCQVQLQSSSKSTISKNDQQNISMNFKKQPMSSSQQSKQPIPMMQAVAPQQMPSGRELLPQQNVISQFANFSSLSHSISNVKVIPENNNNAQSAIQQAVKEAGFLRNYQELLTKGGVQGFGKKNLSVKTILTQFHCAKVPEEGDQLQSSLILDKNPQEIRDKNNKNNSKERCLQLRTAASLNIKLSEKSSSQFSLDAYRKPALNHKQNSNISQFAVESTEKQLPSQEISEESPEKTKQSSLEMKISQRILSWKTQVLKLKEQISTENKEVSTDPKSKSKEDKNAMKLSSKGSVSPIEGSSNRKSRFALHNKFSKDFGDTPEVSSLFKKGTSFILRGSSSERNKLETNYHKSQSIRFVEGSVNSIQISSENSQIPTVNEIQQSPDNKSISDIEEEQSPENIQRSRKQKKRQSKRLQLGQAHKRTYSSELNVSNFKSLQHRDSEIVEPSKLQKVLDKHKQRGRAPTLPGRLLGEEVQKDIDTTRLSHVNLLEPSNLAQSHVLLRRSTFLLKIPKNLEILQRSSIRSSACSNSEISSSKLFSRESFISPTPISGATLLPSPKKLLLGEDLLQTAIFHKSILMSGSNQNYFHQNTKIQDDRDDDDNTDQKRKAISIFKLIEDSNKSYEVRDKLINSISGIIKGIQIENRTVCYPPITYKIYGKGTFQRVRVILQPKNKMMHQYPLNIEERSVDENFKKKVSFSTLSNDNLLSAKSPQDRDYLSRNIEDEKRTSKLLNDQESSSHFEADLIIRFDNAFKVCIPLNLKLGIDKFDEVVVPRIVTAWPFVFKCFKNFMRENKLIEDDLGQKEYPTTFMHFSDVNSPSFKNNEYNTNPDSQSLKIVPSSKPLLNSLSNLDDADNDSEKARNKANQISSQKAQTVVALPTVQELGLFISDPVTRTKIESIQQEYEKVHISFDLFGGLSQYFSIEKRLDAFTIIQKRKKRILSPFDLHFIGSLSTKLNSFLRFSFTLSHKEIGFAKVQDMGGETYQRFFLQPLFYIKRQLKRVQAALSEFPVKYYSQKRIYRSVPILLDLNQNEGSLNKFDLMSSSSSSSSSSFLSSSSFCGASLEQSIKINHTFQLPVHRKTRYWAHNLHSRQEAIYDNYNLCLSESTQAFKKLFEIHLKASPITILTFFKRIRGEYFFIKVKLAIKQDVSFMSIWTDDGEFQMKDNVFFYVTARTLQKNLKARRLLSPVEIYQEQMKPYFAPLEFDWLMGQSLSYFLQNGKWLTNPLLLLLKFFNTQTGVSGFSNMDSGLKNKNKVIFKDTIQLNQGFTGQGWEQSQTPQLFNIVTRQLGSKEFSNSESPTILELLEENLAPQFEQLYSEQLKTKREAHSIFHQDQQDQQDNSFNIDQSPRHSPVHTSLPQPYINDFGSVFNPETDNNLINNETKLIQSGHFKNSQLYYEEIGMNDSKQIAKYFPNKVMEFLKNKREWFFTFRGNNRVRLTIDFRYDQMSGLEHFQMILYDQVRLFKQRIIYVPHRLQNMLIRYVKWANERNESLDLNSSLIFSETIVKSLFSYDCRGFTGRKAFFKNNKEMNSKNLIISSTKSIKEHLITNPQELEQQNKTPHYFLNFKIPEITFLLAFLLSRFYERIDASFYMHLLQFGKSICLLQAYSLRRPQINPEQKFVFLLEISPLQSKTKRVKFTFSYQDLLRIDSEGQIQDRFKNEITRSDMAYVIRLISLRIRMIKGILGSYPIIMMPEQFQNFNEFRKEAIRQKRQQIEFRRIFEEHMKMRQKQVSKLKRSSSKSSHSLSKLLTQNSVSPPARTSLQKNSLISSKDMIQSSGDQSGQNRRKSLFFDEAIQIKLGEETGQQSSQQFSQNSLNSNSGIGQSFSALEKQLGNTLRQAESDQQKILNSNNSQENQIAVRKPRQSLQSEVTLTFSQKLIEMNIQPPSIQLKTEKGAPERKTSLQTDNMLVKSSRNLVHSQSLNNFRDQVLPPSNREKDKRTSGNYGNKLNVEKFIRNPEHKVSFKEDVESAEDSEKRTSLQSLTSTQHGILKYNKFSKLGDGAAGAGLISSQEISPKVHFRSHKQPSSTLIPRNEGKKWSLLASVVKASGAFQRSSSSEQQKTSALKPIVQDQTAEIKKIAEDQQIKDSKESSQQMDSKSNENYNNESASSPDDKTFQDPKYLEKQVEMLAKLKGKMEKQRGSFVIPLEKVSISSPGGESRNSAMSSNSNDEAGQKFISNGWRNDGGETMLKELRVFRNVNSRHDFSDEKSIGQSHRGFLDPFLIKSRIIGQYVRRLGNNEYIVITVRKDFILKCWDLQIYIPKTQRILLSQISHSELIDCSYDFLNSNLTAKLKFYFDNKSMNPFESYLAFSQRLVKYSSMQRVSASSTRSSKTQSDASIQLPIPPPSLPSKLPKAGGFLASILLKIKETEEDPQADHSMIAPIKPSNTSSLEQIPPEASRTKNANSPENKRKTKEVSSPKRKNLIKETIENSQKAKSEISQLKSETSEVKTEVSGIPSSSIIPFSQNIVDPTFEDKFFRSPQALQTRKVDNWKDEDTFKKIDEKSVCSVQQHQDTNSNQAQSEDRYLPHNTSPTSKKGMVRPLLSGGNFSNAGSPRSPNKQPSLLLQMIESQNRKGSRSTGFKMNPHQKKIRKEILPEQPNATQGDSDQNSQNIPIPSSTELSDLNIQSDKFIPLRGIRQTSLASYEKNKTMPFQPGSPEPSIESKGFYQEHSPAKESAFSMKSLKSDENSTGNIQPPSKGSPRYKVFQHKSSFVSPKNRKESEESNQTSIRQITAKRIEQTKSRTLFQPNSPSISKRLQQTLKRSISLLRSPTTSFQSNSETPVKKSSGVKKVNNFIKRLAQQSHQVVSSSENKKEIIPGNMSQSQIQNNSKIANLSSDLNSSGSPSQRKKRDLKSLILKNKQKIVGERNLNVLADFMKPRQMEKLQSQQKMQAITEEMDSAFATGQITERTEGLVKYIELKIWENFLSKSDFKTYDKHFKVVLLFGNNRLNVREQLFHEYIRVDQNNESIIEVDVELQESVLLIHRDPALSSRAQLLQYFFTSFRSIPYSLTSNFCFTVQNVIINKGSVSKFNVNVRELLNLFIAEGFYRFQTNYMSSKVNYSELKNLAYFLVHKIKNSNFLELMKTSEKNSSIDKMRSSKNFQQSGKGGSPNYRYSSNSQNNTAINQAQVNNAFLKNHRQRKGRQNVIILQDDNVMFFHEKTIDAYQRLILRVSFFTRDSKIQFSLLKSGTTLSVTRNKSLSYFKNRIPFIMKYMEQGILLDEGFTRISDYMKHKMLLYFIVEHNLPIRQRYFRNKKMPSFSSEILHKMSGDVDISNFNEGSIESSELSEGSAQEDSLDNCENNSDTENDQEEQKEEEDDDDDENSFEQELSVQDSETEKSSQSGSDNNSQGSNNQSPTSSEEVSSSFDNE